MISDALLHQLIVDPLLPIPDRLSKRDLTRVRELRAAYAAVFARRVRHAVIRTPEQAAEILVPLLCGACAERFVMLALNPRSCLINEPVTVSLGDVDGTEAGPRLVFRNALQAGATSVIVAHNHPTGNPQPSSNDCAVTQRLVAAGKVVDVALADHLIIGTHDNWVSLRADHQHLWSGA